MDPQYLLNFQDVLDNPPPLNLIYPIDDQEYPIPDRTEFSFEELGLVSCLTPEEKSLWNHQPFEEIFSNVESSKENQSVQKETIILRLSLKCLKDFKPNKSREEKCSSLKPIKDISSLDRENRVSLSGHSGLYSFESLCRLRNSRKSLSKFAAFSSIKESEQRSLRTPRPAPIQVEKENCPKRSHPSICSASVQVVEKENRKIFLIQSKSFEEYLFQPSWLTDDSYLRLLHAAQNGRFSITAVPPQLGSGVIFFSGPYKKRSLITHNWKNCGRKKEDAKSKQLPNLRILYRKHKEHPELKKRIYTLKNDSSLFLHHIVGSMDKEIPPVKPTKKRTRIEKMKNTEKMKKRRRAKNIIWDSDDQEDDDQEDEDYQDFD